jgi:DNA-binding CsgD family transcriptional regulator
MHCLHRWLEPHKIPVEGGVHLDEVCCWCGVQSCRNGYPPRRKRFGHGEFAPAGHHSSKYRLAAKRVAILFESRSRKAIDKAMISSDDLDILRMLAAGKRQTEISAESGINADTIANRMKAMAKRMGARTTLQLMAMVSKAQIL